MLPKLWHNLLAHNAVVGAVSALTLLVCTEGCGGAAASSKGPQKPAPTAERAERSMPVFKSGGEKLIAEVGSAGGRLSLENGAVLEIPEGALSENVEIAFSEGTHTTAFSNHEYERPVGPIVEIGPPLALNQPFKLSVPLSRLPEGFEEKDLTLAAEVVSDEQRAVQMHGVQTRWDYLPARSDDGRAVAELNEVPGYRMQFVVSKGN